MLYKKALFAKVVGQLLWWRSVCRGNWLVSVPIIHTASEMTLCYPSILTNCAATTDLRTSAALRAVYSKNYLYDIWLDASLPEPIVTHGPLACSFDWFSPVFSPLSPLVPGLSVSTRGLCHPLDRVSPSWPCIGEESVIERGWHAMIASSQLWGRMQRPSRLPLV